MAAERILEALRRHAYQFESADGRTAPVEVRATASIGVAACPSPNVSSAAALVSAADEALYRAKREGRNTIRSHEAGE